ncbi:MAG: hypothetical protein V4638_02100 [Bacteroidota bacterium]
MKISSFFFLFSIFVSTISFGQLLDNRAGNAFTDKPFFNSEFVQMNKIQELKGQYTYKKPGETMKETKFFYEYSFDPLGRLTSTFETRTDDGSLDTTWNRYFYGEHNQLIEHLQGDVNGFTSMRYEYDDKDRMISQANTRSYKDSLGNDQVTILNKETMSYSEYDSQVKKTIHNSFGNPYLEEWSYHNDLGYLTSKIQRQIMTSTTYTFQYSYYDNGYLSEISKLKDTDSIPLERTTFSYDQFGNILEKKYYRNEIFVTEIAMLYNEKSMLLTYVITKDVPTGYLMILGFKPPKFYGEEIKETVSPIEIEEKNEQ